MTSSKFRWRHSRGGQWAMRLRANIFSDSCGITDHTKHMIMPNRPYQTEGKGRSTICALQFDSSIFSYKLLGSPLLLTKSYYTPFNDRSKLRHWSRVTSPLKNTVWRLLTPSSVATPGHYKKNSVRNRPAGSQSITSRPPHYHRISLCGTYYYGSVWHIIK